MCLVFRGENKSIMWGHKTYLNGLTIKESLTGTGGA